MSSGIPDADELLRQEEERERALDEARQARRNARTMADLKAENRNLHKAVDVLEEHLAVRRALAEAIAKPPIVKLKKREQRDAAVLPLREASAFISRVISSDTPCTTLIPDMF